MLCYVSTIASLGAKIAKYFVSVQVASAKVTIILTDALPKKCPFSDFLASVFSRVRTEYSVQMHPYSVRIRENADQNNSKYGHFSHSDINHIINI